MILVEETPTVAVNPFNAILFLLLGCSFRDVYPLAEVSQ